MISQKKIKKLKNKEYRAAYMSEVVRSWVVYQIKTLRKQRDWSQNDLAEAAGKNQSSIGRWESDNYRGWNINSLLELADAFDVALEVRFVSWPQFMRDTEDKSESAMVVPSFSSAQFDPPTSISATISAGAASA